VENFHKFESVLKAVDKINDFKKIVKIRFLKI